MFLDHSNFIYFAGPILTEEKANELTRVLLVGTASIVIVGLLLAVFILPHIASYFYTRLFTKKNLYQISVPIFRKMFLLFYLSLLPYPYLEWKSEEFNIWILYILLWVAIFYYSLRKLKSH